MAQQKRSKLIMIDQGDPANPAYDSNGNLVHQPAITITGDDAKDFVALTRAIAKEDLPLANSIRAKFGFEQLAAPRWLDKSHTNGQLLVTTGKVLLAGVVVYLAYRVGKYLFFSREEAEQAATVTGETVVETDAVFQSPAVPSQVWMPPAPVQARS